MPMVAVLLGIAPVREFAMRRLAAAAIKAWPKPRQYWWGRAVVRWSDGTIREGRLRVGGAHEWTGAVLAEVTRRLLAGEGKLGAWTPVALFGSSLAESCGGEYLITER
jgi:hypothetical protein